MPRLSLIALSLLLLPALSGAQGTVQLRDPRRPPPLEPPPECELWRGHIAGNDPSAEATLQICTSGDSVHGVFLWSSLESGWNRRTFVGQWLDARQGLELRDTAMLENHPAHGWRLCLGDRYALRRVSDTELTGEFWSQACNDHGTIRITRLSEAPALADAMPSPTPMTRRSEPAPRRRLLSCDAAPGGATAPGAWLWGWGLALAAISRSRGWRGRRSR
nr:hypothetical protein [Deltaproteobacteria bacterium]